MKLQILNFFISPVKKSIFWFRWNNVKTDGTECQQRDNNISPPSWWWQETAFGFFRFQSCSLQRTSVWRWRRLFITIRQNSLGIGQQVPAGRQHTLMFTPRPTQTTMQDKSWTAAASNGSGRKSLVQRNPRNTFNPGVPPHCCVDHGERQLPFSCGGENVGRSDNGSFS